MTKEEFLELFNEHLLKKQLCSLTARDFAVHELEEFLLSRASWVVQDTLYD